MLVNVFTPYNLKMRNKEHRNIYLKLVELMKTRFNNIRYSQRYEDYRLLMEKINPYLKNLNSFSDVCNFIIRHSPLGTLNTAVRLAQIALLIPPTTSIVESCFSITNFLHDTSRNRLENKMVNFNLMIKVNSDNELLNDIVYNAAVNWIRNKKKRRELNEVISILYSEGRIDLIPNNRNVIWKENKNETEKTNVEDLELKKENFLFSALNLVCQDEEKNVSTSISIKEDFEPHINNFNEITEIKRQKRKSSKGRRKCKFKNDDDDYYNELEVIKCIKENKRKMKMEEELNK
jgi:hypothetical protein